MSRLKLGPCPFCGCKAVQLETYEAAPGSGFRVRCLDCDAEGPVVFGGLLARDCKPKHRREAVSLWNERARL
jgi:Lar family restriction alleviation protein